MASPQKVKILLEKKWEGRTFAYIMASSFAPLQLRMVHIVHYSTGNLQPTHNTFTHSQRRLFEAVHLLRV